MKQYRVTQHNADQFHFGEDYFDQHISNCDIALLQRVPEYKISFLKEQFSKVYYTNHSRERSNGKTLNLVIAGPEELSEWSHVQTLPSYSKVMNSENEYQGCKALYVKLNNTLLSSVLPCFPEDNITSVDAETDVRTVFEYCQSQSSKCLLVGDIHLSGSGEYKKISEQYGFIKNYLESEITFKTKNNNFINLDWCLSNSDSIIVNDILVHKTNSEKHGHLAITYNLKI